MKGPFVGKLKPLEHKFKSFFFWLCRGLLKKGRPGFDKLDAHRTHRVLFLRPEKIGDMVISFPVFDALVNEYPHIKISLLGSPRNFSIVRDDPRFEKVFLYRKNLSDFRTLKAIRQEKYDCVLDMINDDSATTLFLSQLAAPGSPRIGIGKRKFAEFYDSNYAHADGIGRHIIHNTLKLLVPFGINGDEVNHYAPPYVVPEEMAKVDEFIAGRLGETLIGFNLSAGKPNRIWSDERAEQTCRELMTRSEGVRIILITAPSDRTRGEKLQEALEGRVSLVPAGKSLTWVSGLISRLTLLISPDTSLIHIARSYRVPVVGLYSLAPKNFRRWRPFEQPDGAVVSGHEDDIYDITADQITTRAIEILKREKLVAG
ncbi:MAG: glycosyltransferase family 9 protein [bacterium]|nr:glycosyltransferase family 9 protein [bacterium]